MRVELVAHEDAALRVFGLVVVLQVAAAVLARICDARAVAVHPEIRLGEDCMDVVTASDGEKVDSGHRGVVHGTLVAQLAVGRERVVDDGRVGRAVRALRSIH